MKSEIERRLADLERATMSTRQVLIAGATGSECARRWAAWCAAHPGELATALYVVTGVPRAALGAMQ